MSTIFDEGDDLKERQQLEFSAKISIAVFGIDNLFDLQSLNFLTQNIEALNHQKSQILKCEGNFRKRVITCLALSGALALSARRYLPSVYSNISSTSLSIDLGIAIFGGVIGINFGTSAVEETINKIICSELQAENNKIREHLKKFSEKYKITEKHLAKIISVKSSRRKQIQEKLNKKMEQNQTKKSDKLV